MSYGYRYVDVLPYDGRLKFLVYSVPGAVRARAHRELESVPENDYQYLLGLRACPDYEPLKELLEGWNSDGIWGIDRFFLREVGEHAAMDRALVDATTNLVLLNLYNWDPEESTGHLNALKEQVLSRQQDDGYIQFISPQASWTRQEPQSIYRSDHWCGVAVSALLKRGIKDNRIDRFLNWIVENQRPDGGWLPEYYCRKYRNKDQVPSHPLHTTAFARALFQSPEHRTSSALKKAVIYLLERCFKGYKLERADRIRWKYLSWPDFGFSALSTAILAADTGIGIENPYQLAILDWLKNKQEKGGLWPVNKHGMAYPDEMIFLSLEITILFKKVYDDLLKDD